MKKERMKFNLLFLVIVFIFFIFIFNTSSFAATCNLPGDFCGPMGDPTPDGKVDFNDLMVFATAYGSETGDPNWNALCDICGYLGDPSPDNKVNFDDLMIFATNYGKECPSEEGILVVASAQIDLETGGVVEVTDETSEIYGTRFVIDPIDKKQLVNSRGFAEISIILDAQVLGTSYLGDSQGWLITPVGVISFENDIGGSLEIKYNEMKLSNSGVAKDSIPNVYRVEYSNNDYPWEEVPEEKITYEADRVKIKIGEGDADYLYALTVTNCDPDDDLGTPLPGDLLYRLSEVGVNDNWVPGHVGIYVGERYGDHDDNPSTPDKGYNVIEALGSPFGGIGIGPDEVLRTHYEDITKFGGDDYIYMGAREPAVRKLTHLERNQLIAYLEDNVGDDYDFGETLFGIWFGLAKGDEVKGDDDQYNCVGLAEAAYESVGAGIVSDDDEGNNPPPFAIFRQDYMLSPQEQLFRTVPASGIIGPNTAPDIFWLEMVPENPKPGDSVNVTCHVTDQDGDTLSYEWTIEDGNENIIDNFDKLIKGNQIDFQIPSIASNYKIICRVFDNYGGEAIIYYEGGKVEGGTAIPWTLHEPENSPQDIIHEIITFWDVYEGAINYKVYRKVNDGSLSMVYQGEGEISGENGEKRQYEDFDIQLGNKYEYYIIACGDDWEVGNYFETGPLSQFLPPIYLNSPSDQTTVSDSNVSFQWTPLGGIPAGFNGPGKTELELYDVDTNELIWHCWFDDVTTSSTIFNQDGKATSSLIQNHTYGWRVRNFAFDQNMEDVITQSEYWEFTFGTSTGSVHNLNKDTYYDTIQAAFDDASSGDTIIVADGTYTENVDVNKDHLTIKSENGADVTIIQAANSDDHVFEVTADYVNINTFTISGADGTNRAGICLREGVGHCNISDNVVRNNECGISLLSYSNNNNISENSILDNVVGIHLCGSGYNNIAHNDFLQNGSGIVNAWLFGDPEWNRAIENRIIRNNISGGGLGIYLRFAPRSYLRNNSITNNTYNFGVWGSRVSDYVEDIDSSNTLDGKPMYYLVNEQDKVIDAATNAGYVGVVSSVNVTVKGVTIDNIRQGGILFIDTTQSKIENVMLLSKGGGIVLRWSSNNEIIKNNISYNFQLIGSSENNTVYLNNFAIGIISPGSVNTWSSPEEITYIYSGNTYTNYLGNYWIDYSGGDANGDGIGDTPYIINEEQDNYPLVEPFENY